MTLVCITLLVECSLSSVHYLACFNQGFLWEQTAQALLVLDCKFSLCSSRCKRKSDSLKVSLVNHLEWIKKSPTVFWWPLCLRGFRIIHCGVCVPQRRQENAEIGKTCIGRQQVAIICSCNCWFLAHTYLSLMALFIHKVCYVKILSFVLQNFVGITASTRSNIPVLVTLVSAHGEHSF